MASIPKPSEAVKVVVRVRPFNKREKELNSKSCIAMDTKNGMCTLKMELGNPSQDKPFKFDSVFDQESRQDDVFDATAKPIVDSVIEGYNGTVFAYGQTGAGKTFTMEGVMDPPELIGLITRCFNYVFQTIDGSTDGTEYLVRVSMLEIYNEQIRDLLGKDPKACLELKDSKDRGIYVKDLSSYVVKGPDDIAKVMRAGKKNRTVATTLMNSESSRSHSIITITVESSGKSEFDSESHIKVGKLNMVDLAGSERPSKTGAKGDTLKEGIEINLSLSALGNVISALVDSKSKHIPYRDSKLTRLLQDSLGGNTKTVMVANISPADDNKDETLSTLRYATRAKKIQNKPIINEDPKDAMLRALQDEIKKLQAALEAKSRGGASPATSIIAGPSDNRSVASTDINTAPVTNQSAVQHSLSEEQLKQMMLENETEKKKLVESMKNQSEEEKKKMIEEQAKLEEERQRIEDQLKKRHEQIESEKKERELLQKKLQEMQANVVKGKKRLMAVNKEQEAKLRKQKEELQRRKEEEEKLKREMEEKMDERLNLEEKYASIQEEVQIKTKKLKKLWKKYQLSQNEIQDIQSEFNQEREDYLFTIRKLERDLRMKKLVIDNFIPKEEVDKVTKRAVWDEEADEYKVQSILVTMNLIDSRPQSGAQKKSTAQPSSPYMLSSDVNPRFKTHNIITLELEMPERTTEDYDAYCERGGSSADGLDQSVFYSYNNNNTTTAKKSRISSAGVTRKSRSAASRIAEQVQQQQYPVAQGLVKSQRRNV